MDWVLAMPRHQHPWHLAICNVGVLYCYKYRKVALLVAYPSSPFIYAVWLSAQTRYCFLVTHVAMYRQCKSNLVWHIICCGVHLCKSYYNDVIISSMASQITSLTIVYSAVYSGLGQRKHQSSASLAFVREFRAQMASIAENVPIWWRHHEIWKCKFVLRICTDMLLGHITFVMKCIFMYILRVDSCEFMCQERNSGVGITKSPSVNVSVRV